MDSTLVTHSRNMTDDEFVTHMNMRHRESTGYTGKLDKPHSEYVTICWRAFHASLHKFNEYDDHEHGA